MLWLSTGTLDQWDLGEEKGEGERESKREGGGKRDREKGGKMAGENQAMNIRNLLMVH